MNDRGRELSSTERQFFTAFFNRLHQARLPFVLLRNYSNFPAQMGHDIDIFFRRSDVPRAVEFFRETLRESGGECLHVHERDYVLAVWFRAAAAEPRAIHLDFYHGAFTWHSLPYLSEEEVIAASRPLDSFRTPRPAHEALNLFLTSLLWGGFFKSRYRERIGSLIDPPEEAAEFHRVLEREFGPSTRPPFTFAANDTASDETVARYAARLKRSFRFRSLLRRPAASLVRLTRYWMKELHTVVSPPGVVVAIMGPDGAGKSTVIAALKERIDYFLGETVEYHWRPSQLPDLGVLFGKRTRQTGPVTDPHGHSPSSPPASLLRFLYYWLDYWLGYPLRVWKPKAKNHLVLFDRYAPDMWCDPLRYRLQLPQGLMKPFCAFVPRPDVTFVLLAKPEIIHQRKAEVPLATLQTLLGRYEKAAQANGRTRAIDCSRPVEQVADEIAAIVMEHFKKKGRRHRCWQ